MPTALPQLLLCLLACLAATGCDRSERSIPEPTEETYFPIAIGDTALQAQIALNDAERARGLMGRDSLPTDHGMIFLFPRPERRSFWMRDTRIPLDLAFFDAEGALLEVKTLYPFDETAVRSRSDKVLLAVETNRGWFALHGLRAGDRLDLAALAEAVEARGFSPADFQLAD